MTNDKTWQLVAGLSGFMGVAMGAVSAHAMGNFSLIHYMEEGVFFQLLHAPLLLWLADKKGWGYALARSCFLLGTLLFSGSFYVRALTAFPEATMFAPYGGSLLLLGWLAVAFAGRKYT